MRKLPLVPLLMVLFFVVLMTNMGFWQLDRAKEKEQMLKLLADDHLTEVTSKSQMKELPRFANIQLNGRYLNAPQILLDNQVDSGVQGYHVFTPFVIDGLNMYIMVNRGWITKSKFTEDILTINSNPATILGKFNTPPQVGIQLGEIELDLKKPQQVITYFDKNKVSTFLHEALCKDLNCVVSQNILWLKTDQSQGFKRDWNPIIMLPSKHTAYAVQWFAMTIVLILIFIYWLVKNKD
jgi:surfeit locus 1 family protein